MKPRYHRPFWQLAQRIHARLIQPRAARQVSLPEPSWDSCVQALRMLKRAQDSRWGAATRIYQRRLADELESLKYLLTLMAGQLAEQPKSQVFAASEIYRDLVNLETEFPEVGLDGESDQFSVTTAPIVLEGFDFGPFRIELNGAALHEPEPFRVIALEPRPAGSKSDITHPHVSDQRLCLGAGRHSVADALASGRLLDFFTIVDRLLHTYARGQAYVELDDWNGTPCIDCGSVTDEDNRFSCDRCEEVVCSDCHGSCPSCGNVFCASCTTSCQQCHESSCLGCLATCAQCGAKLCPDCFETSDTCQQCHEELEDSTLDDDEGSSQAAVLAETKSPAAVPADRLGQAAVFS